MKAVVLTGVRKMELRDIPEPQLKGPKDVLLKIEAVGVCGSDVHYYEAGRIGSLVVEYPFVVGHECAAMVTAIGDSVSQVKIGDRVAVEPAVVCHNCDQCRQGRENTCRNVQFLGCPGQLSGCLCEYIVMPEDCCLAISEKITSAQAVLCEPLSIAIYAIKRARLSKEDKIAILGAGPIGLSCMVVANAEKVNKCYVTEKVDERVEIAGNNAASWIGNPLKQDIVKDILDKEPMGLDVIFECAGQKETIDQSMELLKPGGRLMLIGIPRENEILFIMDKMRRKEVTIINVRRQNKCTKAAIDLTASGRINIDFMITHRFTLEQTQAAFDMVADYRDGVVKALIEL